MTPEANDVLVCAHELMAYYYRCGESVLSDPPKTEAFLNWMKRSTHTSHFLAVIHSATTAMPGRPIQLF